MIFCVINMFKRKVFISQPVNYHRNRYIHKLVKSLINLIYRCPIQANVSQKQLSGCLLTSTVTSTKEALKHSGNMQTRVKAATNICNGVFIIKFAKKLHRRVINTPLICDIACFSYVVDFKLC